MPNITSPFFIGYSTLEEWLRAYRKLTPFLAPVQVLDVQSVDHGQHGLSFNTYRTQVTFTDDDAVHYCLIPWGRADRLMDQDLNKTQTDAAIERSTKGGVLIRAWLARQHLDAYEAIVAFPKDLTLLDGWAAFLVYHKETNSFDPLPEAA